MSGADARRVRVEQGLTPVLRIAGRPPERYPLAERMARYQVPGCSLAAIDDGEISWAGGYGSARAGGAPVHATTLFQAASISKAVAAVGVLVLVEWGELDLDEPVNDRLRSWRLPDSEHTTDVPVTLRHLLSHTGGTTVPGFPGYAASAPLPSVVDVLSGASIANTPAVESFTRPGAVTQYSGGGSTIVQLLLTEVTGRSFPELMAELVLRPFGMVDSAYEQPLSPARRRHAAAGHDGSGRPIPGDHHTYPELQAAGLWTTAIDLARWLVGVQQVLRGDRDGPISRETAELMITPVGDDFGLGPELEGDGELRRFGHSGGNEGFRTQMDALITRPVGGVVLTNGENGSTLCAEVRRAFADEYGWGELDGPPIELADVDPSVLAGYAGFYEGPFGRPMKLVHDDDGLYSPAPYGRRRMLPLGTTTFLDEETGATLEVELDGTSVRRIAVLVDGAELMAFTPAERDRERPGGRGAR
ncbi:MAG: beta-lactamase family protein [Acidimicrobiales bacterium]|nr:beta-lactamase family protein [Acidimicrobiales bacterium]